MKKVLITGASGLLGRSILNRLAGLDKYYLYAVTTKNRNLQDSMNMEWIECDLTDSGRRKNVLEAVCPDIMIHLAWNQEKADFRMSSENLRWLEISMDLLFLFEKCGGKKFLFAGSSSEYDGESGRFSENDDISPESLYGLCKKTFNEFAVQYCRKQKMQYVGMRFFTVYGKLDRHDFGAIPSIRSSLQAGTPIVCKSPSTTRDYIFADDAANVVRQLMELGFCGIINVASGESRTMQEVFETMARVMEKESLVSMAQDAQLGKRLEADISLMKRLGIHGYNSDFETNIYNIVK